jgi:cytochrome c peroxidase
MVFSKRFLLSVVMMIFILSCIIIAAKNVYAINLKSFILKPVPIPKNNLQTKEKIKLGKMLFFDNRLSGDGSLSCASCHVPADGFTTPTRLSLSYPTTMHWRHTPSVIDSGYLKFLFWDGRATSLKQQALGPISAPFEMNKHIHYLTAELYEIPVYRKMFRQVFHANNIITPEMVAEALASFERTIVVTKTPFYSYIKGNKHAMSKKAIAGFKLFIGKASCIRCHYGPVFTDNKFHALGVPPLHLKGKTAKLVAVTRHYFTYSFAHLKNSNKVKRDMGRYLITHKKSDIYKFVTPSLIDIGEIGPYYMHNGSIKGLLNVVKFFNKGGGNIPNKSKLIKPLHLTLKQEYEIVAFLKALDGPKFNITAPKLPHFINKPKVVSTAMTTTNTVTATASMVAGQRLFASDGCITCHTINGKGGSIGPNLSHIGSQRTLAWIKTQIVTPSAHFASGSTVTINGKSFMAIMPNHKGMPKSQLNAIAQYLAGLK